MYHTFYNLRHDPFSSTPDPALFFASVSHLAALHGMVQGIAQGQSCVTVLGQAGLGKTLLLRACLQRLAAQRLTAVSVVYAHVTFDDIATMVCQACGVPGVRHDTTMPVQALHQVLCTEHRHGRRVVLLIDEAHKLPRQTLDHVLQLVNLRAATGESLVQIVFAGLPEFRQVLRARRAEHRQSFPGPVLMLSRLTYQESVEYMQHRLGHMASSLEAVFRMATAKKIAVLARGNPGVLNTLCTNVLIAGALHQQKPVSLALAQAVLAPHQAKPTPWQRGAVYAASALLMAGLFGGVQYSYMRSLPEDGSQLVQPVQPLEESLHASTTPPPEHVPWHIDFPSPAPFKSGAPPDRVAGRQMVSRSVSLSAATRASASVKPVPAPKMVEQPVQIPIRAVRRQETRRAAAAPASPGAQQGYETGRVQRKQGETPVKKLSLSQAIPETAPIQDHAGSVQQRPGVPLSTPYSEVMRRLAELRAKHHPDAPTPTR